MRPKVGFQGGLPNVALYATLPHMETMVRTDYKWFRDKLAERGRTQRALAKYLGIDPAGVSLMLHGKRRISMEEAAKLSSFLAQPISEILARGGINQPINHTGEIPIIGYIDGSSEVHISAKPIGTAPPLAEQHPETVALLYRTAMSSREMFDGWYAYYKPIQTVSNDALGKLAVTKLERGPIVLRLAKRGYAPRTFNLYTAYDPPIESARVEWMTPVLWLRC